MNLKIYFSSFCLLLALAAVHAQPQTSVIEIQKNEKWWGVFVSNAPMEPFLEPFSVNTADSPLYGFYRPVLISNTGRYIWSSEPMKIDFDGEKIKITSEAGNVQVKKGGKNLREAYLVCCHENFPPSGEVPDISLFIMPQYETSYDIGFLQDQQAIEDYASEILRHGLPAGVIVISNGWQSSTEPFTFDRYLYPDPAAMVSKLHGMGFKVMLTVTPYNAAFGRIYEYCRRNGLLVTDEHGDHVIVLTDGGLAVTYDMSVDDQFRYISEMVSRIRQEVGVDGFRFDCVDAIPYLSMAKADTRAFLANWGKFEPDLTMKEFLPGLGQPLTPYVHGLEGGQEGPVSLQDVINDMVSAGLTGYPYSRVISMVKDTAALFSDEAAMAKYLHLEAVMPVQRISFAPWRIKDPELFAGVKDAINLRAGMGDYLRELVEESAKTAEPLFRHMEYQFPRQGFANCDDQFMLGSKYLFAPMPLDAEKRTVRIPKGTWTDMDGKRVKGPVVIEVNARGGRMAYFQLSGK